jgi:tRNA dimethylallyltransferase
MDIITSKPSLNLRKQIPHHLIDIISAQKEYNVSQFRSAALKKIKEIIQRKKIPLLVGGTGLYMAILLDGIFKAKTENIEVRNRLYRTAQKYGSAYLYGRLKKVDPAAAAKIHPHDTRRIVRALEVFEATGKPISELQKQRKGLRSEYEPKIFCLNMERDKLYQRIDARVDKMFAQGLLKEAKKLLKMKLSKTAAYAIGLRELKGYFEGLYDLQETKRLMKRNSRHYALRQLTWFRKDKRIKWIEVSGRQAPEETANAILDILKSKCQGFNSHL